MDLANILVRLIQYGALLPLFGLAAFALYAQVGKARSAHKTLTVVLAAAGLAAAIASLLMLAAMMSGDPAGAMDPATLKAAVLDTAAGRAGLLRVLSLVLLLGLIWLGDPISRLIYSGVALASLAWAGHAAGGEGWSGALHLAADVLHLWAAGIWLGALVAFCALVAAPGPDRPFVAQALAAFSGIGSAVVATLIATGLVNLQPLVVWAPWPRLTASPWGWLLLVKLAMFAGMLGLAAANRFVLTPRLRAAPEEAAALRRSLALETGLAFAIAALVAVLGTLTPPSMA